MANCLFGPCLVTNGRFMNAGQHVTCGDAVKPRTHISAAPEKLKLKKEKNPDIQIISLSNILDIVAEIGLIHNGSHQPLGKWIHQTQQKQPQLFPLFITTPLLKHNAPPKQIC